jgi:cell division protein FtsB
VSLCVYKSCQRKIIFNRLIFSFVIFQYTLTIIKLLYLALRSKGVTLEVLTTENAVSAYNYLVEEGRVVAAALIPPNHFR